MALSGAKIFVIVMALSGAKIFVIVMALPRAVKTTCYKTNANDVADIKFK